MANDFKKHHSEETLAAVDKQRKIFEKITVPHFPSGNYDNSSIIEDHWQTFQEGWQAAQEVKALDFQECNIQFGDSPAAYLKAETSLGNYTIHKYKYFGDQFATNYFYSGPVDSGKSVAAEETAIEAANIDYRKRVLGCLVNGGV